MILETRYRDIPLDQIGHGLQDPERWQTLRGQPLKVELPAMDEARIDPKFRNACAQPRYRDIERDLAICTCLAWIGD